MRGLILSIPVAGWLLLGTALRSEDGLPSPKELFEQLDQNEDGKLSADEIPKDQSRFFERLVRRADQDKDGQLTLDEFIKGHSADENPKLPLNNLGGPGGQGNPKQRFEMLDRNKDGKVTRDEVPEFAKDRLGRLFDRLGKEELTLDDFRNAYMEGQRGPDGERPRGPLFVRLLDTDHNGRISKSEWAKAGELFAELDKNDDGELDMAELMGPPPEGMDRTADRMPARGAKPETPGGNGTGRPFFDRLDKNGDGKISKDEAPPRMKDRFGDLDKNSDGFLSPEELRAAMPGGRPETPAGKPRPKRPTAE